MRSVSETSRRSIDDGDAKANRNRPAVAPTAFVGSCSITSVDCSRFGSRVDGSNILRRSKAETSREIDAHGGMNADKYDKTSVDDRYCNDRFFRSVQRQIGQCRRAMKVHLSDLR